MPAASPVRRVSTRVDADPWAVLMAAAFGKTAECLTTHDGRGEVVAVCTVDGVPIGRAMRDGQVIAASADWR